MDNKTKIMTMKIGILLFYFVTFFMPSYKVTISGSVIRTNITEFVGGGFLAFIFYSLIIITVLLLLKKSDYANGMYITTILFQTFLFLGILLGKSSFNQFGWAPFFQFITIASLITISAREDVALRVFSKIEQAIYDSFPNSFRPTSKTADQRYEEEHEALHDMNFDEMKRKQEPTYKNSLRKDYFNQNQRKTEPVVKPQVNVVEEPVIEIEPIIIPQMNNTPHTEVSFQSNRTSKHFQVEKPVMEAPNLVNPFMVVPEINNN